MQSHTNMLSNQPADPHLRPLQGQNYALQPPYPPEPFGQHQNAAQSMVAPHQAPH